MLTAAISQSTLTNVIAYEAGEFVDLEKGIVKLQCLSDGRIAAISPDDFSGKPRHDSDYSSDLRQKSSLADQIIEMLTYINSHNARTLLTNQTDYLMINITTDSLNSLMDDTFFIQDIPAWRFSIDCHPGTPELSAAVTQSHLYFTLSLNDPGMSYWANVLGQKENMSNAHNGQYAFAAFSDHSQTFLGAKEPANGTFPSFHPFPSPYGDIPITSVYMSSSFSDSDQSMAWYGINCSLSVVPGRMNLRRSSPYWWPPPAFQAIKGTWDESKKAALPRTLLSEMQATLKSNTSNSSLLELGSALSGLGSALFSCAFDEHQYYNAQTIDWETYALNFLYANGEIKRLFYENTAMDSCRSQSENLHQVQSTKQVHTYRIRYVPFILFVAVGALVVASSISVGLALYTWRSISGQELRVVDSLRLIIDCVGGLNLNNAATRLKYVSNAELDRWVNGLKIRYELISEEYGAREAPVLIAVSK